MFPKAKITILAKTVFLDFWKSFPGVDQVMVLESGMGGFWRNVSQLKAASFDAALILPTSLSSAFLPFAAEIPERIGWGGEGRDILLTRIVPHPDPRKKHLVFEYLDLVRKGLDSPLNGMTEVRLRCEVTAEAERGLRQVWADRGVPEKKNYIALAPGATYGPAKRWPLPYWEELISRLLKDRKESLLILGGLEEEAYLKPLLETKSPRDASRLHLLAGRTTPPFSRPCCHGADCWSPMIPGPCMWRRRSARPRSPSSVPPRLPGPGPLGSAMRSSISTWSAVPVSKKPCPIGYKCLHAISVEEVYQAVQNKLKRPGKIKGEAIPKSIKPRKQGMYSDGKEKKNKDQKQRGFTAKSPSPSRRSEGPGPEERKTNKNLNGF